MNKITPIEYDSQRILTTQQLADSYKTDGKVISNNFNRNSERYIESKHYYRLDGESKREFLNLHQIEDGSKNASILYLWTEKGALLHAKSLNTDIAWQIYDELVETYFKVKQSSVAVPIVIDSKFIYQLAQTLEEKEKIIAELTPKAEFFDAVADSKDAVDIGSAAKVLNMGIGRNGCSSTCGFVVY